MKDQEEEEANGNWCPLISSFSSFFCVSFTTLPRRQKKNCEKIASVREYAKLANDQLTLKARKSYSNPVRP